MFVKLSGRRTVYLNNKYHNIVAFLHTIVGTGVVRGGPVTG